ncbi:MAG: sensor domain-containing diguanylate cyclase, partial [Actinomycetota bacterium]
MRIASRAFAVVGLCSVVAYVIVPEPGARTAIFVAVGLVSAAAVLMGLVHTPPGRRAPWVGLIVGAGVFVAVRTLVRASGIDAGSTVRIPSLGDAASLLAYAAIAVGGVVMARSERRRSEDSALNGAIIAVAAGVVVWAVGSLPGLRSGAGGIETLVLIAYPLLDLNAVLATGRMAVHDRAGDVGVRWLLTAWGLLLVADLGYAITSGRPGGGVARCLEVVTMLGFVAFALPSLRAPLTEQNPVPAAAPEAESGSRPRTRLLRALAPALVIVPVVQLVTEITERHWDHMILSGGAVVIAVLVVIRLRLDARQMERGEADLRHSELRLRSLVEHSSDLIAVVDRRGVVVLEYVASSSEALGAAPHRLVGRSVFDVVHPDDAPMVRSVIADIVGRPGCTGGLEVRIRNLSGEWRWDEVRYSNRLDDPAVEGIVLNIRDLTDRHAAHSALLERDAQYKSFFQNNQAVMLLIDPVTDAIVDANPAAAVFYGLSPEQLAMMSILDVRADPGPELLKEMRDALEEERPFWRLRHRLAGGEIRHVEVYSGSIAIGGEALQYEIVHDVSDRRIAEEALRGAEERYRTLVEQLPVATYLYGFDPRDTSQTTPMYVSPQIEDMLAVTPEEWLADAGLWARMVHPEDLVRVDRGGAAARAAGEPVDAVYRMVRRDGRVVWISDSSVPIRDATGAVLAWQGIYQDISAQREIEQKVRANERRFRAVFDGASVAIARLSLDSRVVEANDAMAELVGCSRSEIIGEHLVSFIDVEGGDPYVEDDGPAPVPEEFAELVAGRIDRYQVDRRFVRRSGERLWCHAAVALVRDEDGLPDFAIAMLEDITSRKAAEDELARRAMHDALTGLPNRELLNDRLTVAVSRLERGGAGVAVMFLDLDGFKRVNDELGHDAGDLVLVEVADRFRASLRP